jgi:hypothetical protein
MYAGSFLRPTIGRDGCNSRFADNREGKEPGMIDPPLNFGLRQGSAAIGACAPGFSAPADDFTGVRRSPSRCDLGAFAYFGR